MLAGYYLNGNCVSKCGLKGVTEAGGCAPYMIVSTPSIVLIPVAWHHNIERRQSRTMHLTLDAASRFRPVPAILYLDIKILGSLFWWVEMLMSHGAASF